MKTSRRDEYWNMSIHKTTEVCMEAEDLCVALCIRDGIERRVVSGNKDLTMNPEDVIGTW